MIKESISQLLEGRDLSLTQARLAMEEIMSGESTPAQTAAFLVGLKRKGETIDEVTALAGVMRAYSRRIHPKVSGCLLDTCGTGGDRTKTFNVSTTSAFVIAGAGVRVAKHGNRSFTSRCGSADVLETLGLNLDMSPETVEQSIEQVGIGFMYAPTFHPAMAKVGSLRRELGVRTVFNILGPLTNPAGANVQLLGVYDQSLLDPMCIAAHDLGCTSVMTVHALDGIDELSITGTTMLSQMNGHGLERARVEPETYGLTRGRPEDIAGGEPEDNARTTAQILSNKIPVDNPKVQMVLLNSAAALTLCGMATDPKDGVELAKQALKEGRAFNALRELIRFSGGSVEGLDRFANA